MALDKLEEKAAEQSQSDLTKQEEEHEDPQKGNKQLAYVHAAQKEAQQVKAAEIEEARGKLGKAHGDVLELEEKYQALGGNKPKEDEKIAEPAVPTPGAAAKAEEKKAALEEDKKQEKEAAAKNEVKKAAEEDKAGDNKAGAARDATREELVAAYDQEKAATELVIDLMSQLAALELDISKQKKLQAEVKDVLKPAIAEIEDKKAQIKV